MRGLIPYEYANSRLIDDYLESEVFEEECFEYYEVMGLRQLCDYHYLLEEDRYPIEKAISLLEQLEQFGEYVDSRGIGLRNLQKPIDELLNFLDAVLVPIRVKAWLREKMDLLDEVKNFVKLD